MKNRESFPRFVSHCHFRETLICWFGKTFFFRVALGTPVKCPNLGLLKEIGMADTFHGKRILRGEGGRLSLLFFLFFPFVRGHLKKKFLNSTAKLLQMIAIQLVYILLHFPPLTSVLWEWPTPKGDLSTLLGTWDGISWEQHWLWTIF